MTLGQTVKIGPAGRAREDHLTFRGNPLDTRHGWLRLTPAYSVKLIDQILAQRANTGDRVLDPFCGTGTTALACAERGIACDTTDINPFLIWFATAKCRPYAAGERDEALRLGRSVAAAIRDVDAAAAWVPAIHQIDKWWDRTELDALGRAAAAIARSSASAPAASDLLKIAFCRVMIDAAHVSFGHQSMSFKRQLADVSPLFDSPAEATARSHDVAAQFERELERIVMATADGLADTARVVQCDARQMTPTLKANEYSLVITSPPYPNRMSYVRELRPYMYWLGFLTSGKQAGELDWQAIGGTWGCATSRLAKWVAPLSPLLMPNVLLGVVERVGSRSPLLATYIQRYFADMAHHVVELFKVCRRGAEVHYIVGNSRFYESVLPVEEVFAQMFEAAGFERLRIDTLRKRTSKKELFEFDVVVRKP